MQHIYRAIPRYTCTASLLIVWQPSDNFCLLTTRENTHEFVWHTWLGVVLCVVYFCGEYVSEWVSIIWIVIYFWLLSPAITIIITITHPSFTSPLTCFCGCSRFLWRRYDMVLVYRGIARYICAALLASTMTRPQSLRPNHHLSLHCYCAVLVHHSTMEKIPAFVLLTSSYSI